MDTPLAATVHKKNVHVGGGKTFTMRKPIKLKAAGKRRNALADFRDTYAPSSGVSNDVDLKPMAHGKQQIAGADPFTKKQIAVSLDNFEMGSKPLNHELSDEWDSDECVCSTWAIPEDEVSIYNFFTVSLDYPSHPSDYKGYKYDDRDTYRPSSGVSNDVDLKPMAHGKQQIAGANPFTTKKQIGNKASRVANLNTLSVCLLAILKWGVNPLNHVLSDEEIKQRNVWDFDEGIDECDCSTWAIPEDEESYNNLATTSFYPHLCNDKGYDIEDPDLHSPMSFPGPRYTPEEIFGASSRFVLFKCPPLELESEDDFGLGE